MSKPVEHLSLPDDPAEALAVLLGRSGDRPTLLFKKSPVCPVSSQAEAELERWLEKGPTQPVAVALVDVIDRRALARGLTAELGIRHESPQVLLFSGGELRWHESHAALTAARFAQELGRLA